MTDLRDARERAVRRRWRDLGDDFARGLRMLLDDLEAADREHGCIALGADAAMIADLTPGALAELRANWDALRDGRGKAAGTAADGPGAVPAVNHPPGGARGADGAAEAPARRRTARKGDA